MRGDADARELVVDPSGSSEEFARLWALQEVAARRSTRTVVVHPDVGRLELECDVVISPPSRQRLDLLGVVGTQDLAPAPAQG